MASPRENLQNESLGQLADRMQFGPSSLGYYTALAELERRRTISQLAATEAAKEAADSAKATAKSTKKSARYILLSVVAILLTSGASALFSFLAWKFPLR